MSARFQEYKTKVENLTEHPGDDNMLMLYRFYKQATEGDAPEKSPYGMMQFKRRAMWKSWDEARGLSKEDAEMEYIKLAKKLLGEPEGEEVVAESGEGKVAEEDAEAKVGEEGKVEA